MSIKGNKVMNDVKAIRVGDKIIIFVNGKRQVISKGVSPEIFNRVCILMEENNVNDISSLFNNFENNISDYLKDYFAIEKSSVKLFSDKNSHPFSKLIIRKSSEFMALKENPLFIFKMANKIKYVPENVCPKGNELFSQMDNIVLTKNGNIVLSTYEMNLEDKKLVGYPKEIDRNGNFVIRNNTYSIPVCKKSEKKYDNIKTVLISPFDIVSFTDTSINVTRYKILKGDNSITKNGLVEIENEELFDISYDIYINKFESK